MKKANRPDEDWCGCPGTVKHCGFVLGLVLINMAPFYLVTYANVTLPASTTYSLSILDRLVLYKYLEPELFIAVNFWNPDLETPI